MTLPVPLSLLPSCQLWVDGERFADGCTEGELPVMRIFGQWQIADNLPDDLLT